MFVKERGRINLQWKSCLIYIMLKFCNSVLLINNNFVSPVWFSRGNTFATLVSCLSLYKAASPRLVVTVSKTLSTWQEQLNMKVMVSRGTVCKKEKWDETIKHKRIPWNYYSGLFHLGSDLLSSLTGQSCEKILVRLSNSLLRMEILTLVQSWEGEKLYPSTILERADDLCFRSLAPQPLSLTLSVPPSELQVVALIHICFCYLRL